MPAPVLQVPHIGPTSVPLYDPFPRGQFEMQNSGAYLFILNVIEHGDKIPFESIPPKLQTTITTMLLKIKSLFLK